MTKYLADDFSSTFDPTEIKLLADALVDAWVTIRATGTYTDGLGYEVRNILAEHILRQAMNGERNQKRLSNGALAHLAKQRQGYASSSI